MATMEVKQIDAVTVIRLAGELTASTASDIERGFVMTTSAAERVVVDLSGVTMITTPGITMLVAAERNVRRRRGKLVLCGLAGKVEQVLVERCRLDAVFTVKPTVDDGVAAASA